MEFGCSTAKISLLLMPASKLMEAGTTHLSEIEVINEIIILIEKIANSLALVRQNAVRNYRSIGIV